MSHGSNDYSEYFNARKPSAFGMPILKWWHNRMLGIAKKYIPEFADKTLLEIGVGHGFIAEIYNENNMPYIGHEMNQDQAQYLALQGHAITAAKIPPIPAGKPAHIIWLSHILEHAKDYTQAKEMLTACYERLEKSGYVVIIAPDILHWKMLFWSEDWSHGFPTSIMRVEQLLNETGFTLIKSLHHACTLTNSMAAFLISKFFTLLPITLLDAICKKITGRSYFQSFLNVYGLRQIFIIAQKA